MTFSFLPTLTKRLNSTRLATNSTGDKYFGSLELLGFRIARPAPNVVPVKKFIVEETVGISLGTPHKEKLNITIIDCIEGDMKKLLKLIRTDVPTLGPVYRYDSRKIAFRSDSEKELIYWVTTHLPNKVKQVEQHQQ